MLVWLCRGWRPRRAVQRRTAFRFGLSGVSAHCETVTAVRAAGPRVSARRHAGRLQFIRGGEGVPCTSAPRRLAERAGPPPDLVSCSGWLLLLRK